MITGQVSDTAQAKVGLTIYGPSGVRRNVSAVVDTGFSGTLSLPFKEIEALGLPWRQRGRVILADGSERLSDVYESTVEWDGRLRRVAVDRAEIDPIIGMRLLFGYEVSIEVFSGGRVAIKSLT